MRKSTRALCSAAVICTLTLSPCAFAAKWQVTDLGPVGLQSWLYVNNQGQVAGTFSSDPQGSPPYSAFVTGPNGANRHDLYPDNSLQSVAGGINDAGQVLSTRGSDNSWEQQVSNINSTAPTFQTVARSMYFYGLGGINRNGVVVGSGSPAAGTTYGYDAFIANADGSGYKVLSNEMDPLGATSAGVIVYSGHNNGWASVAKSATTASVRLKGPTGTTFMPAYGINDKGQVVGEYRLSDNWPRAFVTGSNGTGVTSIGTLGSKYSDGFGVGSTGIVVGDFGNNFDFWHAMITDAGGKNPRDLSAEVKLPNGGFLTSAYGINDKGQVVASDYYNGRAYLLTPIGESDCAVTYKRVVLSNKSVATQVTVANLTSAAQKGWSVNWRLDTASRLSTISGAKLTMSGNNITAVPTNNGTISGKSQVSFSFQTTAADGTTPTVAEVTGLAGGQTCKVILP
jgi:probable HAF family extracellular repeat protein